MRQEFCNLDDIFQSEVAGCRNLIGLADNLSDSLPAMDLADLYRHSLVAAVSALDTFVHGCVRVAILLQFQGVGPLIDARLSLGLGLQRRCAQGDIAALREMDLAIRQAHSRWTMQFADDIAEALKLVSNRPFWRTVSSSSAQARVGKGALNAVVRRRNQIAHESDLDPSTGEKWPMDSSLALRAVDVVADVERNVLNFGSVEY